MLELLHEIKAKVVVITDGRDGAYAYDGEFIYKAPTFPAEVVSTLGAGDAFAARSLLQLQIRL
jgi:sugar/nucleoside kinase (ribokinase family)